jgi:hypothetical protein
LQRPVVDQRLDLRGAQCADPVQLGGAQLVADARGGEHAPIPDQGDVGQLEPGFELGDLGGQGFRVAGVAVEHLDGDRHPGRRAQQPVDDLAAAFDSVAGVPDLPERAAVALERRRGHVIKHQRAVNQMPGGQGVFDRLLARQRPVHRGVQVVLIGARDIEYLAQGAGGGLGAQPARDRQFRSRFDDLPDQHGQHQIAVARGGGVDQLGHAQRGGGAGHRGHMSVRQAAGDVKDRRQIPVRRRQALERALQPADFVLGPA